MAKSSVSLRIPKNILNEIEEIQEAEGLDSRAEAARQVLRRGIEHKHQQTAGERLGQQSTAVGGVGTVTAAIAALLGQPWATALVVPFAAATFLFSMLWASVRVLEGRDLV